MSKGCILSMSKGYILSMSNGFDDVVLHVGCVFGCILSMSKGWLFSSDELIDVLLAVDGGMGAS